MPITFACDCGQQFTVADGFAGKRTRCPKCTAPLTVPAPEPEPTQEELSDEDKAFRALAAVHDDPRPSAPPIPAAGPPKLKKASEVEKAARKERKEQKKRELRHDPDRPRRILYMIGGVLMALAGGAIGFFSIDEGISV